MPGTDSDKLFAGAIPRSYETYLVPLLFEPYAADLAPRVAARSPGRVLELAAGTGVATRALDATLPARATIVATDLNQAMLDEAAARGSKRAVEWRAADAMQLPFEDESFDAVACQFGVMFFPDKPKAYAEARRVLRPKGALIFNVWDQLEENEIAYLVEQTLVGMFPDDPPGFLGRTPYGYHDIRGIRLDLARAGFESAAQIAVVAARSRAASAHDAAVGFCQGTPSRNEIEARDATRLEEATDRAAHAIALRLGGGAIDARMRAHVITIEK